MLGKITTSSASTDEKDAAAGGTSSSRAAASTAPKRRSSSSSSSAKARDINHSPVASSRKAGMERETGLPAEVADMADEIEDAEDTSIVLPEDPPNENLPVCEIEAYANGNISEQEAEAGELSPLDSERSSEIPTLGALAPGQLPDLQDSSSMAEDELMRADYASTASTPAGKSGGAKPGSGKRGQKIQPRQTEFGSKAFECPKCSICFDNEQDLNNHISDHNKESTDPNTCVLCGQRLSSASSLDRHMLVHSGHRPFSCNKCGMTFTTNGNMHRHMRTHTKNEQQEAAAQLLRHRGSRGRGGGGSKEGPGGKGRAKHFPMSSWPYPSMVMHSASTFLAHGAGLAAAAAAADAGLGASTSGARDKGSPAAAVRLPAFPQPINIHPAFGLLNQPLMPVTAPAVAAEVQQGESGAGVSELQCPLCKQRFLIEASLTHHLNTHHNVRCRQCSQTFHSAQKLLTHMRAAHGSSQDSVRGSPPQEREEAAGIGFHDLVEMPFTSDKFHLYAKANCEKRPRKSSTFLHNHTCNVCGNAFPTLQSMKLHRLEHSASTATTCHCCHVTFTTREELTCHMKVHSAASTAEKAMAAAPAKEGKEEDVQSWVSQESFLGCLGLTPRVEKERLVEGMAETKARTSQDSKLTNKTYFQDLSKYKMGKAEEGVEDNILARLQKNGLTVGLVGPVLDPNTPVVLVNGAPAQSYSPVPDGSGDRSFDCKYCDEVFPTKKELNAHVRNHKGVAPYQCEHCSYKSTDKSTLKRHYLTHTGERPHVCILCQNAFTTKANCERHIRKKHNHKEKEDARRYVRSLPRQSTLGDLSAGNSQTESPEAAENSSRAVTHEDGAPCKVYRCTLCGIGFLSRFLATRHVQHRHGVQAKLLQDMLEECSSTKGITMATDEESIASGCSTPDNRLTPLSYVSTPPRAHSTPPGALSTPPPRALAISGAFAPAVPFPPHLLRVKLEPEEEDDDSSNNRPDSPPPGGSAPGNKEEPMDLSTKSSPATPERQQPSSSKDKGRQPSKRQQNHLSGPHFLAELSRQLVEGGAARGTSDQNNNSLQPASCPSLPSPASCPSLPSPASCPSLPSPASLAPITALALQAPRPSSAASPSPSTALLPLGTSPDRSANYGSDSSSDLASIHRIIDATNTHNFRLFLPTDADEDKGRVTPGRKRLRDNEEDEDDASVDFEEEEDEDEVDKDDEETRLLEEACGPGEGSFLTRRERAQAMLRCWLPSASNSNSPDDSRGSSEAGAREGQEPKPKKKRNSYADTPHNLYCKFPGCSRSFPWQSSLNRHMSTHTGLKPFLCSYCSMQFSTKSNRERHLVRKHGVNMLDPASRQTMDRPFKCHVCTFSSFATESNLRKHYQERHNGDSPPALSQSRELEGGESSFVFPPGPARTGNEDSPQTSEQEDREQSPSSTASRNGLSSEADSGVGCDVVPTPQQENQHHVEGVHMQGEDDDDDEEEEDEDDEDEESSRSHNGRRSAGTKPAESEVNPERDNYNVDKITSCWKCREVFDSRKQLLRHLKEHNIDLPFKCYLCDASYDSRKVCLRHMQQEHEGPWQQVSQKNGVNSVSHFASKMDDITERNCRLSQMLSPGADPSALLGEGEGSKAGEEGSSSEGVTADYVQRKVYCSFCPKRFWSLQDLRRHMRSHTGERPYECSICLKRFTLKHSMTRHQTKNRRCGCGSPALSEGSGGDEAAVRPAAVETGRASSVELGGGLPSHSLLLSRLASKTSSSSSASAVRFLPIAPTAAAAVVAGGLRGGGVVPASSSSSSSQAGAARPEQQQQQQQEEDLQSTVLTSLLGLGTEDVDQLLNCSSDNAAKMLGIPKDSDSEEQGGKAAGSKSTQQ